MILQECGIFKNLRSESILSATLKSKAKERRSDIKKLESSVKNLESKIEVEHNNKSLLDSYNEEKSKLNQLYNYITEGVILRSKATWYEQGEKNTSYFYYLEKQQKNKSHVRKLNYQGKEISEPKGILHSMYEFYKGKFSKKGEKTLDDCINYLNSVDIPKLPEEVSKEMGNPVTLHEVYKALSSMSNKKSPGNDGLPREFYINFFSLIGEDLVNTLNYSYEKEVMSVTQRQSLITLVQKQGKDICNLKNWRPISLLNVDTKILGKILVSRMKKHLPNLIHCDQSAFVSGRCIGHAVRQIFDIIEYSAKNNKVGLMFRADFESAFDSTDMEFIVATLLKFGFSTEFVKWVKLLYKNAESCLINNGFTTKFFPLQRGTRQGDPLSPYLFLLVVEILASKVRQNPDIKGIKIGNTSILQTIFADDFTFFWRVKYP